MKKHHTLYVCQSCAYSSPRWVGRCPNCGAWNSFIEEAPAARDARKSKKAGRSRARSLAEIQPSPEPRSSTHIPELDRVLGGGIVPGSVVLVGGDPGIGKSTLMMQMAAETHADRTLYITGEESLQQIRLRADRLEKRPTEGILLLAETDLEQISSEVETLRPSLIVVDSIQTMYRPGLESTPGSVSQVREATALFMRLAKENNIAVFLVGHVTKEGLLAGPRVVEHMVDTVLQFEGDRQYPYRILRAVKNRFGSTNEIGIFEMRDGGLEEVANPSEVFLSERSSGTSGSSVVAAIEGTRPLLLELQALVAPTSYGVPQRTATGFDTRRLQMLLAVLERRVGLHVGQYDVFVNVAGGVRIDEPGADLGMALSIVSSLRDRPVDASSVVVGEVGLGGEIRRVYQMEKRLSEAAKLGFRRVVIPARTPARGIGGGTIEIVEVETLEQAIGELLGS